MIRNYLKISWRNLLRNKTFSLINILGLALGLACSLLIMLFVQNEISMDGFHANNAQLYQVYERQVGSDGANGSYLTQGLLAMELKQHVPGIAYASALERDLPRTITLGNKRSKMEGAYAHPDFFKMFSYPILQGGAATALDKPGSIAVSRKIAEQFFGSTDKALGQTLRIDSVDVFISAVFENIPVNSSQQFEYFRNWDDLVKDNPWAKTWGSSDPLTYVQLQPNADRVKVEAQLKDFLYDYRQKDKENYTELGLIPYASRYLHGHFTNGIPSGGRISYVRFLSIIALFILLIACINFMNLATARATKRAREVGIRKVVGAKRWALIVQFIGEAIMLSAFSILIALALVAVLLPGFNHISDKQLTLPFAQPIFWGSLLTLLLLTGFVAGSYPALYLSAMRPVRVLKGTLQFSRGAGLFRKGLVVFQFSLSILLIISMIVMYRQMDYVQSKDLGYDRDNLVYIPLEGSLLKRFDVFKEQAGKIPGVSGISEMTESPTQIEHHKGDISWEGKAANVQASFTDAAVSYDFARTMHLQFVEGRDFSKAFGTDSIAYVINETAVKKMGIAVPVGKIMGIGNRKGPIIGVLKDFHFNSMHEAIAPLVLRLNEHPKWGTALIRIKAGNTRATLEALEATYMNVNPGYAFSYQFSDAEYAKLYKGEQGVNKIAGFFAILAIFISCLGLLGLAIFTAAQRMKEIGVRKVLGASVSNIVLLLSGNFLKPVMIAILIAMPIAWWMMSKYLDSFAYKINLDWWLFVLAGLLAITIALLTVSYQSIKAAIMDPVKSLKAE